jgi:hypothetical protein
MCSNSATSTEQVERHPSKVPEGVQRALGISHALLQQVHILFRLLVLDFQSAFAIVVSLL